MNENVTAEREEVLFIEGSLPPGAAAYNTSSILYLPFDVPEGVTRIHVRREYDPHVRDTVGLLVYDPRGNGPGGPGFRGYQGAVNMDREFTLTASPESTTPWYTPGPLTAGTWHLAQWYIQPTPGGLRYCYTITLTIGGAEPAQTEAPNADWPHSIAGTGPGWYMGSLHNHTVYSYDTHLGGAPRSVEDLVSEHREAGFRFLAVTDHNQARAHADFAAAARAFPDMLLLAGNELTTLHGHAGIHGIPPGTRFDFRMDSGDGRVRAVLSEARAMGALFVINHPFGDCIDCPWRYADEVWDEADAIEVWNRSWADGDRQAVDAWDALLKAGRRIAAVGGTDYHRGMNRFAPTLWTYAESLSQTAIFAAIRAGRCILSESPSGPRLALACSSGDEWAGIGEALCVSDGMVLVQVRVTGGAGCRLRLVSGDTETWREINRADAEIELALSTSDASRYVRAELIHPGGRMAALTDPVYLTPIP